MGIPVIEQAWRGYHQLIDSAKAEVERNYSRGLFIDMHGHAHVVQRIELGYLISKSELQLSDEELDTEDFILESSVRTLVGDNISNLSHSELLRGDQAFGTLLGLKGLPSVPSLQDPFPLDEDAFFSGGFNTVRHGSRDNGGNIDAIQIEMNPDIRFDEDNRAMLIDSLATVILDYISLHYNDSFQDNFCNIISDVSTGVNPSNKFTIFPNPANGQVHIKSSLDDFDVHISNSIGQAVYFRKGSIDQLDLSFLQAGYYLIQLRKDGLFLGVEKLIISR